MGEEMMGYIPPPPPPMTPKNFYRYIRPLKFDEKRLELQTVPHGGVCLRFDTVEGGLRFNYARCHPEELFSKAVAKKIADARSDVDGDLYTVPFTEDTTTLTVAVIARCFESGAVDGTYTDRYKQLELRELGTALEQIVRGNQREHEKAAIWRDGIAAMLNKDRYESLSR